MASQASQNFVPIKEIRDGVVLLKDGSLRAVLLTSSVNLSLKSEDEQQAVLLQFQNFLNTLDFDVQISIQSRKRDMRPYLALLEEQLKAQQEPLLKVQTREYMEFIKTLSDEVNVMTKLFYIVVPYAGSSANVATGIIDRFLPSNNKKAEDKKKFEQDKSQLDQRIAVIEQTLTRTGVRVAQLNTAQLTEMYYRVFNPGSSTTVVQLEQV